MTRRRAVVSVLAVLTLVMGGCSDDDGGGDAVSPGSTTTAPANAPDTTDAPETTASDDPAATTTTTSGPATTTTTSPNLPPSDSALQDLVTAPGTFGAGYAPDDTYGDGTFDGDLCEEVTIDPTWDDQAGQALGAGEAYVLQAVLRFADDAGATAFVQSLTDGVRTCDPNLTPLPVEGAGDAAVRLDVTDEEGSRQQVIVRVGPLVTSVVAVTPDGTTPLTDDVVRTLAEALTD